MSITISAKQKQRDPTFVASKLRFSTSSRVFTLPSGSQTPPRSPSKPKVPSCRQRRSTLAGNLPKNLTFPSRTGQNSASSPAKPRSGPRNPAANFEISLPRPGQAVCAIFSPHSAPEGTTSGRRFLRPPLLCHSPFHRRAQLTNPNLQMHPLLHRKDNFLPASTLCKGRSQDGAKEGSKEVKRRLSSPRAIHPFA